MTVLKSALNQYGSSVVRRLERFGIAMPAGVLKGLSPMLDSGPMRLETALTVCFPHGGITISTMQNAIRQGKLNCSRLGRVYMVTAEDIQDWMKSCRVEKKQGSISASEKAENQDGSFSTADENIQQAIAEQIARRQRHL